MGGIENREHRLLKQIFQTNTSIHMQFAFTAFSLLLCTQFLFGCVLFVEQKSGTILISEQN